MNSMKKTSSRKTSSNIAIASLPRNPYNPSSRKTLSRLFRLICASLVAASMLFSLVSCGNESNASSGSNGNQGKQAANGQAGETADGAKDSLVLAVSAEPENGYDPTIGWGHSGTSIVHGVLFVRNAKMEVTPSIATGYDISEDGLTWTIEIRNDIKFSDGTPLTAGDVSYTFNTTKATKGSNTDLTMMDSATAKNDTEVEFKLKYPNFAFIDTLMTVGIVPERLHKNDSLAYAENPVGCGPYVLRQWDRGQQAIFERNENYFGTVPEFKRITLLFLDTDAAVAAVQAGQVDMAKVSYIHANIQVEGMKTVEVASIENLGICFPIPESHTEVIDGVELPIGNDVTSDIAIRKAINIVMSRNDMIAELLNGYGSPAYTGYEQMPWNDESTIKDGDIEGAKKLLADAGWQAGSDGILEKGRVKAAFDLIYTESGGVRQDFAVYAREKLREIGIQVNPVFKNWTDAEPLFHASPTVFAWGEPSPKLMYQLMHSDFQGVGFFNPGFYSNATVDRHMMNALASAADEESNEHWRKAIYDGTSGFGFEGDAAWAWFMNINHIYLMNENLDIGTPKPQTHGGAITENIAEWKNGK